MSKKQIDETMTQARNAKKAQAKKDVKAALTDVATGKATATAVKSKVDAAKKASKNEPAATVAAPKSEKKPNGKAAKPEATTVKSDQPKEKKVAASAKPSITQVLRELFDQHGVDKVTIEMAAEAAKKIDPDSKMAIVDKASKAQLSWHKGAYKKLMKA